MKKYISMLNNQRGQGMTQYGIPIAFVAFGIALIIQLIRFLLG